MAEKWNAYDRNNEYYIRNKFEKTLDHIDFNIDVWYQHIEKYTFDTKFIDIAPKFAKSIILFYRYRYCHASVDTLNIDDVNNLRELYQMLDKEINECIKYWYDNDDSYKEEDKGVFIRFSNRSPKDGHKVRIEKKEETKDETKDEMKNNDDEKKDEIDPNEAFIQFCRKSAKDLFVNNGQDAMALILSSERVFTDLLCVLNAHKYPYKYLFYHQFTINTMYDDEKKNDNNDDDDDLKWKENKWEICRCSIAIRKWDNRIRDDLEFRCFIYNKKLRAISQYNHYCYFKELGDNELFVDAIKEKIEKYFYENIVDKVPYFDYVIDIGIIVINKDKDESNFELECIVIELNPYATSTGAGLYNWGNDEKQLKYGTEIEIRVHKKSVLSANFVDHYLNDFEKYSVETPWFTKLDELESKIIENKQQKEKVKKKKSDCIIL